MPGPSANKDSSSSREASPRHLGRSFSDAEQKSEATTGDQTSHLRSILPLNASVETVASWLNMHRYGQFLPLFKNFEARDLLRLMREDLVGLCGLGEGLRMYNDLHLMPVAPRLTLYVAQKGTNEYTALFLEELSVTELILRLANSIGVEPSLFTRVFIVGPGGIQIRVTDSVIQFSKPETVYQFTLRTSSQGAAASGSPSEYEVVLENMSHVFDMGSQHDFVSPPPPPGQGSSTDQGRGQGQQPATEYQNQELPLPRPDH